MKKYILAVVAGMIAVCANNNAQAGVVTINGGETWAGYMNWFNLTGTGGKGSYADGSSWGLGDVQSTFTGNTITLYPNFNTYRDNVNGSAGAQAYWTNGAGGGNKWMEGNTFVEKAPGLLSGNLTFTGNVDSYSLGSGYSLIAFIKGLNPNNGYSTDIFQQAAIGSGSTSFSVSADLTNASGLIVQYGFTVSGINANEAAPGLGSAVVSAIPEPSVASLLGFGVLGLVATRLRRRS
jgi:hypothetical protein